MLIRGFPENLTILTGSAGGVGWLLVEDPWRRACGTPARPLESKDRSLVGLQSAESDKLGDLGMHVLNRIDVSSALKVGDLALDHTGA